MHERGQASLELVVAVAGVVLLASLALSAFLDTRDSTLALASVKALASAELSKAPHPYRIEKLSFTEDAHALRLVVHLQSASPPLDASVRQAIEALGEKIRPHTAYRQVEVRVAQG